MSRYSVILVDDEEEVRLAIQKRIDWDEIGFYVAATAENGEEALELSEKLCPDVVMTDIQMPFMDGLTFCRKLKEKISGIKIVIFSGYDEFDYAKEAIRLEAEEYILKPIDALELKEVFLRIRARLDEELDRRRSVERLEKYYQESIPLLQEQFLMGILTGRFGSMEQIHTYEESYGMSLTSPFYSVGVFCMDTGQEAGETLDEKLQIISLKQMVDEELLHEYSGRSIHYLGTVIVIALLSGREQLIDFIQASDRLCKRANRVLHVDVTAGIGQVTETLVGLHNSYTEALSAVEYRILLEPNQSIFIQDIEPKSEARFLTGEQELQSVLHEIKVGTEEGLEQAIHHLAENVKALSISIPQLQNAFMEMTVEIMRLARVYEVDLKSIEGMDMDFYAKIKQFTSLDMLGEWLLSICMQLRGQIRRERTDTTRMMMDKAKQYIHENYADCELSVEKLCDYLGLSATYFSTLFKRETGESFVVFLTRVRMEQALQLLNTTEEKAYVISELVGYTEPNYFSYVFKKQYGVSPSKYRTNRVKMDEK